MVQLKVAPIEAIRTGKGRFNTTMVQLKVESCLLNKNGKYVRFNTTMVQLKAVQ